MSGKRRRKSRRRYNMDLHDLDSGIFISDAYKGKALAITAIALGGLFLSGFAIGYLMGKYDE